MKLLRRIFIGIFAIAIMATSICAHAATNLPMAEIGDYGTWATDGNIELFNNNLRRDIADFQAQTTTQSLVPDYVPIEARIGIALMNGLSLVGQVLDGSLVRFVIIFLIVAYIFWIIFETYNMMTRGSSAMELGVNLVKKGAVLAIWIIILSVGAGRVFMWVMSPILGVATYLSDLILNGVVSFIGTELPDTCAAIHQYAAAHISPDMPIDADAVANLMCVPTRLSGFFATAIAAGWQWVITGIGTSAFTVLVGVAFICIFVYIGFKFALMALGVIVDLFLGILMLPFTAIAETLGKTSYKGIAGDIFNGFLRLFNPESLSVQIQRFIQAAIYFVALSVIIALCAALLSGTITTDMSTQIPTLENNGFIVPLLTGCLVAYLANHGGKIAEQWGGKVNAAFGTDLGANVKKMLGSVGGLIKKLRKK